jgi:hypothetical protein
MPDGRRCAVPRYVVKDERWSTLARFEAIENAYR